MKEILKIAFCLLMLLPAVGVSHAAEDADGCKDHPLFSRMPNYYINNCKEQEFDSQEFWVDGGKKKVTIEGHKFSIEYKSKGKVASELQVQRNYTEAIKKIGGAVMYMGNKDYGEATMKVVKNNKEIWARLRVVDGRPQLDIVEKEEMNQDVVANAEAMGGDIKTTGHAAIYGIYFDTGKSVIKPESDAAISEIAKLLKQNSSLKIYVVGHTDNVGSFDSNMKLSQARAEAVAKVLVSKNGIAASRLKAYGVSSLSPVASNKTDDGKTKNRRVELVEQ